MVNALVMNLLPGNMFKDFLIESNQEYIGAFGRPKGKFTDTERILKGCLADATQNDRDRWKQLQHPITHTIVQAGPPMAKEEDRLVLGDRVFTIHAVDDCGALGITTIYYAEERADQR